MSAAVALSRCWSHENLDRTPRDDPAEREASAAADAVTSGRRLVPRLVHSPTIACQDMGTPDSGPSPYLGGAPDAPYAPDREPYFGAPEPVPMPAPGTHARPRGSTGIPRAAAWRRSHPLPPWPLRPSPRHRQRHPLGRGGQHQRAKPVVAAVLDPAVAAGDPRVAGLTWSGPGVTPTGNPLEAEVDRTAGERRVTATLDGVSASTTLWSVFAVIRASYGPLPFWIPNRQLPDQLVVGGRVEFEATIFPASILGWDFSR
jgi:hypothetical protein